MGKIYSTPLYKMIVIGFDINGNLISRYFEVSRFGVKDGVTNPPLKTGNHTVTNYIKMSSGIYGFQINNGKYFIHKQYGNDTNFGCITLKGNSWNRFLETIETLGWNSDISDTAQSRFIKINVIATPYPIILWD